MYSLLSLFSKRVKNKDSEVANKDWWQQSLEFFPMSITNRQGGKAAEVCLFADRSPQHSCVWSCRIRQGRSTSVFHVTWQACCCSDSPWHAIQSQWGNQDVCSFVFCTGQKGRLRSEDQLRGRSPAFNCLLYEKKQKTYLFVALAACPKPRDTRFTVVTPSPFLLLRG